MGRVWSLRGRSGFDRVRSEGRAARADRVSVRLVDVGDGLPVRLGMAVGKSVGGAVQRNVVRRRIRQIVGEVSPQLTGTLVVVRAFPGATEVPFDELKRTVQRALGSLCTARP